MIEVADYETHPATWSEQHLVEACSSRRQRRSGPGGQHRNKVETAVVYEFADSAITGSASEQRSQEANRKVALFRLRVNLALQLRCQPRSECSALWRSRLRQGRVQVNPGHADFPALLSEVLDHVLADQGDLQQSAETLLCTKTQLFKFLKLDPRAAKLVNDTRESCGMKKLR